VSRSAAYSIFPIVLWLDTMREALRCRECRDEWIGAEIGLSWYTLQFPDRHDELGYMMHCAPRVSRNLFISICIELVVVVGLLVDRASTIHHASPWLVQVKSVCLVLLFIACFCYVVANLVPRFKQCTGSFARELFSVFMCVAAIVFAICTGDFYLPQLLRMTVDDPELVRAENNQYQMTITILMLTGSHLMVPVRWYMLMPLELVSIFWHPFWVVLTSSWSGFQYLTWQQRAIQCLIVVFFVMGKRHTECAERLLFKKYLAEKTLRVSTEFQLSSQLAKKRAAPSEISSAAAFANLGLSGELKQEVDNIAALGRKEHWVLDAGITIDQDKILGQGGFGQVCMAHLHGTPTVVKMPITPMHEWVGTEASRLQALGNEIRLLRRLRHPNIVLFHGAVFFDRNTSFGLVLEYVDGVCLNACMSRLSKACCLRVCLDLSRALTHLHAQDPPIVHGDLKPSNLMILQVFWKPTVKLIDFGLARLITPNAPSRGGTREWIPPEQMQNPSIQPTHQLDIFAFGSMAYFMEHGVSPTQGMSSDSEVLLDPKGILTWPNSQRAFLTDCTRDVVHSCLAVDPSVRPESIDDVRRLLHEAVECLRANRAPQSGPPRAIEQLSTGTASEAPTPDWSAFHSSAPEAALSSPT